MAAPHVVHVTTVHPPDDTRILHHECRSLVEHGFRVTLVARDNGTPIPHGVKLVPLRVPSARGGRLIVGGWRAWRACLRLRACLYHVHDPELLWLAMALALAGNKVVYDVHEDVPRQVLDKDWLARWLRRPLSWLVSAVETLAGRVVAGIVAATPTIARRFPDSKTRVVHNFPRHDEFPMPADQMPYRQRPQQVAYVGAISRSRGAFVILDAARMAQARHPLHVVLAGPCRHAGLEGELRKQATGISLELPGWVTREGVSRILLRSRAGLVILQPTPSYLDAYPVKLFEYMTAGLPVIASDFPLIREIVSSCDCGILVDPEQPESVARAMVWLLDNPEEAERMGKAGRVAVRQRYRWEAEAAVMVRFYAQLGVGAGARS